LSYHNRLTINIKEEVLGKTYDFPSDIQSTQWG